MATRLMTTYKDLGLDLEITTMPSKRDFRSLDETQHGTPESVQHLTSFPKRVLPVSPEGNGQIVKKNDHLLDDCRYIVLTVRSAQASPDDHLRAASRLGFTLFGNGWMAG